MTPHPQWRERLLNLGFDENDVEAIAAAVWWDKSLQFCPHCGAGVGKHRREGEGTCPDCPIEVTYERH